ncbi:acyltransferase family protein [Fructobacillus evanidus]|uniref:Contains acyltransferase and SGNH-hydrolase domains (OafA) n=1 Tax=Fructobacillus evanidus TaxID=3064281 RepID=A0ABN9YVJ4_9LACO|nr:Peptidoglycan/LPS O-acetylase OafA/YrhL [Fructobacillus sp. LMG 32999]CAK1248250.1 Peptidoglycan/LPS O-acetylase OafA/YrhL [Fructobacillus sp. LMG 32999]CAK1248943.1 Peptidoglycan/LPS O-acetylase OafA/YrhL [Fructobacillus sp. LMG 32999]CAK1250224.1 Peptidoglycan/LPS O-acetylase OafA/YrhL [Fructobacillus sp. LMG 32999]CAK1250512.1 Peptidoglycan/LPS O-acetylase OafA/YrhL [Fructobacillus sp. LMG 32999]
MRIKWFSFIRIVGLISVLTYHFYRNSYPGGFIGVDVFFTFSGFLITALMIDEFARSNRFCLLAFYRRRFYRIVPPLVISILVVVPLTYLVSPDYITGLGKQITAALGFVTNYFEILSGGSYETKFIPHLFIHTWSLAVEMHFYLVWGLIAFLIAKIIGKKQNEDGATRVANFKIAIFLLSMVFLVASATLMAVKSRGLTDYSPVYFDSLTHLFPFFLGAAVATLTGIKSISRPFEGLIRHTNRWLIVALMALSFAGIFALGFKMDFDSRATYTGGILLASILASLAIVLARMLHDHTPNIDEPKWATFIAATSYSMYLYHWPLFVIFSQVTNTNLAVALTIAVGLPCSALSYYVIEPAIAGKETKMDDRLLHSKALKGLLVLVTILLVAVTGYTVKKAPNLTQLENRLWLGGLEQSKDQMSTYKDVMVDAHIVSVNGYTPVDKIPAGVSIIGDSVTAGARDYLLSHIPDSTVDAQANRSMDLAYTTIIAAQKNHVLRKNVVLCIGTNAHNGSEQQLMRLINDLEPGHHLILMTPYDRRANPTWNSSKFADFERATAPHYDFISLTDWQKLAGEHPEVFNGTDGVHFVGRQSGNIIYTQAIDEGLAAAKDKPVKK